MASCVVGAQRTALSNGVHFIPNRSQGDGGKPNANDDSPLATSIPATTAVIAVPTARRNEALICGNASDISLEHVNASIPEVDRALQLLMRLVYELDMAGRQVRFVLCEPRRVLIVGFTRPVAVFLPYLQ
jgi:hypothetical protein